jgi:S1-C subfamily serine protease
MPEDRTSDVGPWPAESAGERGPAADSGPSAGPGRVPGGWQDESWSVVPPRPPWQNPWAPTGDYPPPPPTPPRGAHHARNLLTYLVVAAVAAAAGAGVTGYVLRYRPAAPVARGLRLPGGGLHRSGSASRPVTGAIERAVARMIRPGLVDISSSLGYQGSQAAATGMIISRSGLVLTNNHVIADTTQLYATLVGTHQRFRATWLGYDATDDIAVIKLIGAHNLRMVPLGDSATVRIGDGVVAFGNANGAGGAPAAAGTVTGLNRTITATDSGAATRETLHGMLQTDAGIVQGDSGGPLANADGRVIGMTTAAATATFGATTQSKGFAIPIDRALRIARQIIAGQTGPLLQIGSTGFMGVLVPAAAASEVQSPRLQRNLQLRQDQRSSGLSVQPATRVCLANDLNAGVPGQVAPVRAGALIIGELCGTPADGAGLIAGDVITAVGTSRVTSPSQLTGVMRGFRPGMAVQVTWVDVTGTTHRSTLVLIQAPPR